MKKGDVPAAISLILVFLAAVIATVVVLSISGKGVTEGGTRAGSSAASMSGAGTEISCSTFCGSNYIGKSPDEQKKGKCMVVRCSSKSYSYGCEYDPTTTYPAECKAKCKAAYPNCASQCDILPPLAAPPSPLGTNAHYISDNCANVLKDTTATTPPVTSGDKLVLSSGGTTEAAQVKVGEKMTVMKKVGATVSPLSAPIDYKLQQAGVDVLKTVCKTGSGNSPPLADCLQCYPVTATGFSPCTPTSYDFQVPAAGMPDGAYTLLITEPDNSGTNLPPKASGAWTFSWTCPAVKIENKPYNAGKPMTAVFESKIDAIGDVTIKLNGGTVTKYPPSATSPNKISFDIPKLGASGSTLIEGNNELVVKREGKGLCLKAGKVENGITETFNWVCPAKGCYQKAGKWYVVSGKGTTSSACASPGSCQDASTGCWYDKTEGTECKHGCADGACKLPDLKIISVKLDNAASGKEIGTEPIYDTDHARDIYVTVKNAGKFGAYDIESTVKKFGSDDLFEYGPVGGKYNLAPDEEETYKFGIDGSSLDVSTLTEHIEKQVSITIVGTDVHASGIKVDANLADNTYSKSISVYNTCYAPCAYYVAGAVPGMSADDAKDSCNSCGISVCPTCHKCQWASGACKSL